MRRIIVAVFVALVALSSCRKQEPEVDIYGGPVTLYRVGDSFAAPSSEHHFNITTGNPPQYALFMFFNQNYNPEFFYLSALSNYTGPLKKGDIIKIDNITLANPYNFGVLGVSNSVEKGRIVYMGEEDGLSVLRFEDLTFKVTRRDESGITDTYYVRGTVKAPGRP